jgi:hypothetical protein
MAAQRSRYCKQCTRATLHVKQPWINESLGCLVTIVAAAGGYVYGALQNVSPGVCGFLGGLLPMTIWFLSIVVGLVYARWRCQTCGRLN